MICWCAVLLVVLCLMLSGFVSKCVCAVRCAILCLLVCVLLCFPPAFFCWCVFGVCLCLCCVWLVRDVVLCVEVFVCGCIACAVRAFVWLCLLNGWVSLFVLFCFCWGVCVVFVVFCVCFVGVCLLLLCVRLLRLVVSCCCHCLDLLV